MRAFLQEWSALIAALLVVIGMVYTGSTIRTHTVGANDRLSRLEKHIASIRHALEGDQGLIVRLERLDMRVNEQLHNLMAQRGQYIEDREKDLSDVQNTLQALRNTTGAIFNTTQRIEYVEEMLLDMQASIKDIKKQQHKGNQ